MIIEPKNRHLLCLVISCHDFTKIVMTCHDKFMTNHILSQTGVMRHDFMNYHKEIMICHEMS